VLAIMAKQILYAPQFTLRQAVSQRDQKWVNMARQLEPGPPGEILTEGLVVRMG
jgi:hypothetical protein